MQTDLDTLRRDLLEGSTSSLQRRRGIVGASLVGMAAMGAVSLLQSGILRHLPDPPLRSFDSDAVNTSDTAYQFGVPDGPITLASLALNVPLAMWGDRERDRKAPWISLLAGGKAAVEALASGWFLYQMPARERAWCGYCIVGALASFGVFALTLPEGYAAFKTLRDSE